MKGLDWIKVALAGTDTASLLEILYRHFGDIDSSESNESDMVLAKEEKTPEIVEQISAKPSKAGHLATAELVFPFKSSPLVVAGIPETYLPLHGPETLSQYHCQVPSSLLKKQWPVIMCAVATST